MQRREPMKGCSVWKYLRKIFRKTQLIEKSKPITLKHSRKSMAQTMNILQILICAAEAI